MFACLRTVVHRGYRGYRRAIWHLLALSALGIAMAPAPGAEPRPLSLTEAQSRAIEYSRQLSARQSAVDVAREMAVAAGRLPDPVLRLGVDNLPLNGPDRYSVTRDFMTMRRIGLMQEFTRGEKRSLRSERFELEAQKARAEKAMTLAQIERETALAWFERYYAEAMAAAAAQQADTAQLEVAATQAAYRAGRAGQAELLAARGARSVMQDRVDDATRRVRSARLMLARWVGEDAESIGTPPDIDALRLDPHATGTLIHHPDIAALDGQVRVAETEARLAEADRRPDWTVEVTYSQRGPIYPDMVSVGVSLPLPWDRGQRQDRELAAKLALAEQARAERDDMLRAHATEVKSMAFEWESKRTRAERYRREILPLAHERIEAALSAYRGGKSSLNDVLAARSAEGDARLEALQLQLDVARLWAQLNYLVPTGDFAPNAQGATP